MRIYSTSYQSYLVCVLSRCVWRQQAFAVTLSNSILVLVALTEGSEGSRKIYGIRDADALKFPDGRLGPTRPEP